MKRIVFIILSLFLVNLFFPKCAVVVSPTGGPRDTIPPVLVRSTPPKNSTNFKRDRVVLTFDEYIKLNQIHQKLVLSPPQERIPDTRIRGRSLEIQFYETLADSTTYTLYFSDAIEDNNEGNKLENFTFAFSTGPYIDSMQISGRVTDAFTLEPKEGVLVMLYTNFKDSIPILERPRYVTKTNKEGDFALRNVKHSDFKIFALKDENSNYKFDQISENIAFLSDTIKQSMLQNPKPDSIPTPKSNLIKLRLFEEENLAIALTDHGRKTRRAMSLRFSRKPEGEVRITPINAPIDTTKAWYVVETNLKGDSLVFWILDDELSRIDTLVVDAKYQKTDSLLNLVPSTDTLRMFYMDQTASRRGRSSPQDEEEEKVPTLSVKPSVTSGGTILPHQSLSLSFDMPLLEIDTTQITLKNITDSTLVTNYTFKKDTLSLTKYHISHVWEHETGYTLKILPNAFTNLDGIKNDTIKLALKGATLERFGNIVLTTIGVTPNVIVELLSSRGAVVNSKTITDDGTIRFTYVNPGTYRLRFIFDENKNGRWDTGRYLKGIQPERVMMYTKDNEPVDIQIRANWDYELSVNLKE